MVKTLSQTPLQLLDSLKLTECHRQRERPKETTQAVPQGSLPLRAVHREAIWLPLTTATLEDSWGHTFFFFFQRKTSSTRRFKTIQGANKTVRSLYKVLLTFSATAESNSQEHEAKGRQDFRVQAVRATLTPSHHNTLKLNSTFEREGTPSLQRSAGLSRPPYLRLIFSPFLL